MTEPGIQMLVDVYSRADCRPTRGMFVLIRRLFTERLLRANTPGTDKLRAKVESVAYTMPGTFHPKLQARAILALRAMIEAGQDELPGQHEVN